MTASSRAIPRLASAIALSHMLKLSLTILSRLLIVLGMDSSPDYRKAYRAAKEELAHLLSEQQRIEKRLVVVRQSLQTLAALCESEGIKVSPSEQAGILLENISLAEEIRNILEPRALQWFRPAEVKDELQRLGHDLGKYKNPQATIQMVLKRMAKAGEVEEGSKDGKKAYRSKKLWIYGMKRETAKV